MKLFLLSLLLVLSINAHAQMTQSVRGQVIDKNSKLPIEGATVSVVNSDPYLATGTDAQGYFKLSNVPIGRQSIAVSSLNHGELTLVKSGKELYLEIELEEKVTKIDEIKIGKKNYSKPENDAIVGSNVNLTPKQTERFAGSLNDVSRMAMNYAGVISSSDNRNDIIIRGNSPSGILWRLNGINIPNPNHFGSLGSMNSLLA